MKDCVACAEPIKDAALKCRYCGTLQNDPQFTVHSPTPINKYSALVELVSGLTNVEEDRGPANNWSNPEEFFDFIFDAGGWTASTVLREGFTPESPEVELIGLDPNEFYEGAIESGGGYEIDSISGSPEEGWSFDYRHTTSLYLEVLATTPENAAEIMSNIVGKIFELRIFDEPEQIREIRINKLKLATD